MTCARRCRGALTAARDTVTAKGVTVSYVLATGLSCTRGRKVGARCSVVTPRGFPLSSIRLSSVLKGV